MARKVTRLTLDTLATLPEPVRTCLFWELDPVHRERARRAGELASEKDAWLSRVLLDWGSAGRVLQVDGDVAGFVTYAPPFYFPGSASLPTAPIGPDAVQLSTAYVAPEFRGQGLGRVLLQSMAKDLLQRGGIRSVEAFGSRSLTGHSHEPCALPADFLLRVGFKTQRPHARHPRLRLELKSILTWREEVEAALEKLVDAVRPTRLRKPAPNARADRRS
ncbi:MAG: GNAT family N-acetyltransferase [Nocardioidaceae bacterium]